MRFRLNVAHGHGRIEYEDIGSEVNWVRIRRCWTGSRGPRVWHRMNPWLALEHRGRLLLRTAGHGVLDIELYGVGLRTVNVFSLSGRHKI